VDKLPIAGAQSGGELAIAAAQMNDQATADAGGLQDLLCQLTFATRLRRIGRWRDRHASQEYDNAGNSRAQDHSGSDGSVHGCISEKCVSPLCLACPYQ
jgi:hypothetical protein